MKHTMKILALLLSLALLVSCAPKEAAQTPPVAETQQFTDSAGRQVTLPKQITRVAPAGAYAQMMIYALAPDTLMGLSAELSEGEKLYLLESIWDLPVFGRFYGKNASNNYEAIIAAAPDVIIEMGDVKETIAQDMDKLQEQTGVPTIFIEANLDVMAPAFESLGQVLGLEEAGKALADYTRGVLELAAESVAKIPEAQRISALLTGGESGLEIVGRNSIHSEVLGVAGVTNAAEQDALTSNSGDTVGMEQLLNWQPDVILINPGSVFKTIGQDPLWADIKAVQTGRVYEIPGDPYNWTGRPPSSQRLLGILWLGNLLYPAAYDFDMVEKAQEFYQLFYHYELTEEQAKELMSRSTFLGK